MSTDKNNTITPTDTIQEVKQKLFNNGYLGLAKQGKWSYESKGCAYRTTTGLKCAIGFSIPDEKYCNSLEGEMSSDINVLTALNINEKFRKNCFFDDFQEQVHDFSARDRLDFTLEPARKFAKKHGLTIPEIKESQS